MSICEKCPGYSTCLYPMRDMSNAKYLCPSHPEYPGTVPLPSIEESKILKANSISGSLNFEPIALGRPFNENVLHIPKSTSLKGIDYDGHYYDIECLKCFKIAVDKCVAIDYLRLLKDTGKLTLEAYNEYIDLSVSTPLDQEEFDSLINYI